MFKKVASGARERSKKAGWWLCVIWRVHLFIWHTQKGISVSWFHFLFLDLLPEDTNNLSFKNTFKIFWIRLSLSLSLFFSQSCFKLHFSLKNDCMISVQHLPNCLKIRMSIFYLVFYSHYRVIMLIKIYIAQMYLK